MGLKLSAESWMAPFMKTRNLLTIDRLFLSRNERANSSSLGIDSRSSANLAANALSFPRTSFKMGGAECVRRFIVAKEVSHGVFVDCAARRHALSWPF